MIEKSKNKALTESKRKKMLNRRYQQSKQKGRAITTAMVFGQSED